MISLHLGLLLFSFVFALIRALNYSIPQLEFGWFAFALFVLAQILA